MRHSRLMSHASCLTPHVSRLMSHASCLTPHVSRLMSHASWRALRIPRAIVPRFTEPPDNPFLRVAAIGIAGADFRGHLRGDMPIAPHHIGQSAMAEVD